MTFGRAAYARKVLRALAGEKAPLSNCTNPPPELLAELDMARQKTAASFLSEVGSAAQGAGRFLGNAGRIAGRGLNNVWQKSMAHNGAVMGTLAVPLAIGGAYALGRHAIGQTRAAYHGFQPEVQNYTRQSPY